MLCACRAFDELVMTTSFFSAVVVRIRTRASSYFRQKYTPWMRGGGADLFKDGAAVSSSGSTGSRTSSGTVATTWKLLLALPTPSRKDRICAADIPSNAFRDTRADFDSFIFKLGALAKNFWEVSGFSLDYSIKYSKIAIWAALSKAMRLPRIKGLEANIDSGDPNILLRSVRKAEGSL